MEIKLTDEEVVKALEERKQHLLKEQRRTGNSPDVQCLYITRIAVLEILDLINRQKAEIERLTEELEAKKKECREIADDYQEMGTFYYNETVKTAELQKQVDELTDKLGKVLSTVGLDEYRQSKVIEQAVKDTAKECISIIDDEFNKMIECIDTLLKYNNSIKIVKSAVKGMMKSTNDSVTKRYGVEVECD